jgi:serine/threonine protein kinase
MEGQIGSSPPERTVVPADGHTPGHGEGRHAGPYRLTRTIGAGAMGKVFAGEHVLLGRKVAVKVMRTDLVEDCRFIKRFISEGRAAARIEHPNVVSVTDLGRDPDGTTWLAMELLEGCDLSALIGDPDMTLQRAVSIARQLCLGLAAVHAHGIVHRDVKPGNVFVTPRREGGDLVTLLDFGIARLLDDGMSDSEFERGLLIGTPAYMAPEQAWGHQADERSDIYSVGAVLFELITDRPLFERGSVEELMSATIFAKPPPLGAWAALPETVAAELEELIAQCVAKEPAARPSTAAEVAERLARIEARLADAARPVTEDRLRSYERLVVLRPPQAETESALAPFRHGAARHAARAHGSRARKWPVLVLWLGLAWNFATSRTALQVERTMTVRGQQLSAAICDVSMATARRLPR